MPTKQFKWIDRDTAARDILQLVYHAPPQIAERAVKLLKAFRSPVIIPELKAMFLDTEYDVQWRREIFEAICATPGDLDFSEFEPILPKVFGMFSLYFEPQSFRLLNEHPKNMVWMLRDIELKKPDEQLDIYIRILVYLPQVATEPILKILSEDNNLLTEGRAFYMRQYGGENVQNWLHQNLKQIIRLWLTDELNEQQGKYWWRLREQVYLYQRLDKWPELKQALIELTPAWVLQHLGTENALRRRLIYIRLLPLAPQTVFELLLKDLEEKEIFLDLEIAALLHKYGDETIQAWLNSRLDELIYLCLIDSIGTAHHAEKTRIVHILEKWPELKDALFQNAPAIVDEYNQKQAVYNIGDLEVISDSDIRASSVWQSLEEIHKENVERTQSSSQLGIFSAWENLAAPSQDDIIKSATEVYFLGTTPQMDWKVTDQLIRLFEKGDESWRTREFLYIWDEHVTFSHLPIRFEAAYALRHQATVSIWTSFIEAFFEQSSASKAIPSDFLEYHLCRWISRMTDILSGIEPELPDEEIPLSARPWFRALVTQTQT